MNKSPTETHSMIERIARAMVAQKGWDWDAEECDEDGGCQCLCCYYGGTVPIETARGAEMESARTAIETLREPTEAMIRALDKGLMQKWPNARQMAIAALGFMADAVLAEEPTA